MGLHWIMDFNPRHVAIAAEGVDRSISQRNRNEEIVDANQPAIDFFSRRLSNGDGDRLSSRAAATPSAASHPPVLERLGIRNPGRDPLEISRGGMAAVALRVKVGLTGARIADEHAGRFLTNRRRHALPTNGGDDAANISSHCQPVLSTHLYRGHALALPAALNNGKN